MILVPSKYYTVSVRDFIFLSTSVSGYHRLSEISPFFFNKKNYIIQFLPTGRVCWRLPGGDWRTRGQISWSIQLRIVID